MRNLVACPASIPISAHVHAMFPRCRCCRCSTQQSQPARDRLSVSRTMFTELFHGSPPALPTDMMLRITLNGVAQEADEQVGRGSGTEAVARGWGDTDAVAREDVIVIREISFNNW